MPDYSIALRQKIETTDEEHIFTFFCFFDDLVTTNTAINLVSRAEQDFLATVPIDDSREELLQKISVMMSGNDTCTRERHPDIINSAMPDIAD